MCILVWIIGALAGLCMVMGIVTAIEIAPLLNAALTWLFWFWLSAILFLASIAFAIGSGRGE